MTNILQIIQVILFCSPVLTLIAMGLVILTKPVSVLDRRLLIMVFIPLLLANVLALLEDSLSNGNPLGSTWRFWLTLVVDLSLCLTVCVAFRGLIIHGMSAAQVEAALAAVFRQKEDVVTAQVVKKRTFLGGEQDVRRLDLKRSGQHKPLFIIDKVNEVLVRGISRRTAIDLSKALSEMESRDEATQAKSRRIGVLYLVMALIFAVSVWILFFEPRLVLIE